MPDAGAAPMIKDGARFVIVRVNRPVFTVFVFRCVLVLIFTFAFYVPIARSAVDTVFVFKRIGVVGMYRATTFVAGVIAFGARFANAIA
jgi:hypothetical protein